MVNIHKYPIICRVVVNPRWCRICQKSTVPQQDGYVFRVILQKWAPDPVVNGVKQLLYGYIWVWSLSGLFFFKMMFLSISG